MRERLIAASLLVAVSVACGGDSAPSSPTAPSPTVSYQGVWVGTYVMRSCRQTGVFDTLDACADDILRPDALNVRPVGAIFTQDGDVVGGTIFLNPLIGSVAPDGQLTFSGMIRVVSLDLDMTVTGQVNFTLSGQIQGTIQFQFGNGPVDTLEANGDIELTRTS